MLFSCNGRVSIEKMFTTEKQTHKYLFIKSNYDENPNMFLWGFLETF